ncbi:MAG: hypothetical protein LBC63_07190 [Holophagales bacterium]|jgi:hypothetical protein|nr:hypothetical protein [Holophagales bacterium]
MDTKKVLMGQTLPAIIKRFFALAAAVLLFSGVQGQAQSKYPTEKEFFPAVYGAVAEMFPKARYLSIDFYNNSFTLTGVTGGTIAGQFSFDMSIVMQDDGTINLSHSNIYKRDPKTKMWESATNFGLGLGFVYNPQRLYNDFRTKILQAANSDAAYERFKAEALSDIQFIYAIAQDFTELAFTDFYKTYIANSVFTVRGRVFEVEEYGKEVNGETYKYKVSLNQNLKNEADDVYLSGMRSTALVCGMYTNQDKVIRMSKSTTATMKGKVVSAARGNGRQLILWLTDVE